MGDRKKKIKQVFGDSVEALTWEDWDSQGLEIARKVELIVNLAGAGLGLIRWTDHRKKMIVDSRLKATGSIAAVCGLLGKEAPKWLNASAVGVYGSSTRMTEPFDEDSSLTHSKDFLAQVARQWEKKSHG